MRLKHFCWLGLFTASTSIAFENAKVLPKGVRNFRLRNLTTSLSEKSTETGALEPLSADLSKEVKLGKVVESKSGLEKTLLKSFLLANDLKDEDSVGTIQADIQGQVVVNAGVMSYGLTEQMTLAFVVPYYQAKMSGSYGFVASPVAEKIVTQLHDPLSNQTVKAREVAQTFNGAKFLQAKLLDNGFADISSWSGSGVGDLVLGAKANFVDEPGLRVATFAGVVAPTGRVKDPDNLLSVPFGDGAWQGVASVAFDEPVLVQGLFLNQYAKVTYVAPARGTFRLKTSDEKISVPKESLKYKLGDKLEVGASVQHEPESGLLAGVGYNFLYKFKDFYDVSNPDVKFALQDRTNQSSHHMEAMLGYSTLPAFKRKSFPIPLNVTAEYRKQLLSQNMHVKDLASLELSVFF